MKDIEILNFYKNYIQGKALINAVENKLPYEEI